MDIIDLPEPLEFEWDEANKDKIWIKHKVSTQECEEVFINEQISSQPDELHSQKENRYILIGKTKQSKYLFIAYTIRNNKVRVISARSMHKEERGLYEKEAGSA